jgi:hypothetical protein
VERSVHYHEQAAAFYEKLLLLDGGTIALSLTFLGALHTAAAQSHIPRQAFLWLVCPAWVLLLTSMQACRYLMAAFQNANRHLLESASSLSSNLDLDALAATARIFTKAAQAQLVTETETLDLAEFFTKYAAVLTKLARDASDKYLELLGSAQKIGTRAAGTIASLSTSAALILLCVFAITVFLAT